jgi:cytochrome c biogenesis protein CcmG, thiol:disulfide interchange protein DsbE
MNPRRLFLLVPLALFAGLALVFFQGLKGDPSRLPSTLINKPVPEFKLEAVAGLNLPGLAAADLKSGGVTIVNIWASWCGPCRQEHPVLMELAKRSDIKLVGINNKDDPANAVRFLGALGQPYAAVGADQNGRVTIDWGGYGVPETFIIDGAGIIRHKHIGPLSEEDVKGEFSEKIAAAKQPLP